MPADNPSGVSGFPGRIADWWDHKKVTGLVAVLVVVGGSFVAILHGALSSQDCAQKPLKGVYKPSRLKVVEPCADVTGTVYGYRHEHDGDWHLGMKMDDPSWVNLQNARRQHGLTVVEFVPLLPRPTRFFVGQRLKLRCTKVKDLGHAGWFEGHPCFAWEDVTPPERTPQPNQPTLAPPTEE